MIQHANKRLFRRLVRNDNNIWSKGAEFRGEAALGVNLEIEEGRSNGGTCTNSGLIEYFKDNRIGGSGGWAAISVSPAGRITRWFWNGSAWAN